MIRLVLADDSPTCRALVATVLRRAGGIDVVGEAVDGPGALELVERHHPDVLLTDLVMPGLDGLALTRRLMLTSPLPIVLISAAWRVGEAAVSVEALAAGALALVARPPGPGHPDHAAAAAVLVETIRQVAFAQVLPRPMVPQPRPLPSVAPTVSPPDHLRLVAVGASTGGPDALRRLVDALPRPFEVPIVVVQHMTDGFIGAMVEWFGRATSRTTLLAHEGQVPGPDTVVFAPDEHHLTIDEECRLHLLGTPPEGGHRPAAAVLFASVARALGSKACGVLLTGMGRDGARELGAMRSAGAITFAQSRESCVVYGMPGEAVSLGAATHELPPEDIGSTLGTLVTRGAS